MQIRRVVISNGNMTLLTFVPDIQLLSCHSHFRLGTMSAITQWTTPALWTLSVLCLTSRAPVEAAYAAPVLLIVDLFNRSRSLSYARTGKSEYVRQPTGKEKRKVRRLNGETEDPIHVEQVRRYTGLD